jgi:transcriptional regulator with XRE-family HTH domain
MKLTETIAAGIVTRKEIAEKLDMTPSMVSQILRGVKPPSGIDAMRLVLLSNRAIDIEGLLDLYAPFMDRKRVKRGGRTKKRRGKK